MTQLRIGHKVSATKSHILPRASSPQEQDSSNLYERQVILYNPSLE